MSRLTHELKTPIASIRLYLETLQTRDVGDTQRKDFYRIMLQDADRLQHTVEQVLKAGHARQKRKLDHRAPVDLVWLVQDCIDTARMRHNLPETAVTLAEVDPSLVLVVDGDVDKLHTAITNLLDNAVKYSSAAPQVSVQVVGATPDTAWVRVKDAGVGIPRAQLGRIFSRFYRFQPPGFKVKGTGLGLYIVRSIAKAHGGRVFAESAGEAKGSTFTLELPRVKTPPAATPGSGLPDPRSPIPDPRSPIPDPRS